jgi:hypothetical protein
MGKEHAVSDPIAAKVRLISAELGKVNVDWLIKIQHGAFIHQHASRRSSQHLGDGGQIEDSAGINGPRAARISEMTETRQTDQLAFVRDGRRRAGKRMVGDAGAQDIKRTLEPYVLSGEFARYLAVSNLVQRCP